MQSWTSVSDVPLGSAALEGSSHHATSGVLTTAINITFYHCEEQNFWDRNEQTCKSCGEPGEDIGELEVSKRTRGNFSSTRLRIFLSTLSAQSPTSLRYVTSFGSGTSRNRARGFRGHLEGASSSCTRGKCSKRRSRGYNSFYNMHWVRHDWLHLNINESYVVSSRKE